MAFINGLFAFVFLGCLIAFLIGLVKPSVFKIRGQPLNRQQVALYSMIGVIVSLLVFSSTISDEQKAEQKAQQAVAVAEQEKRDSEKAKIELEELKKSVNLTANNVNDDIIRNVIVAVEPEKDRISKVEIEGNNSLHVYLKSKDAFSEKWILTHTAKTAETILTNMKKQGLKNFKKVMLHANAELLDQYNNKSDERVFYIEYDYPEVLKLNAQPGLYQEFLRFSKFHVYQKVGRESFNQWCDDEDNVKWSGKFCFNP